MVSCHKWKQKSIFYLDTILVWILWLLKLQAWNNSSGTVVKYIISSLVRYLLSFSIQACPSWNTRLGEYIMQRKPQQRRWFCWNTQSTRPYSPYLYIITSKVYYPLQLSCNDLVWSLTFESYSRLDWCFWLLETFVLSCVTYTYRLNKITELLGCTQKLIIMVPIGAKFVYISNTHNCRYYIVYQVLKLF